MLLPLLLDAPFDMVLVASVIEPPVDGVVVTWLANYFKIHLKTPLSWSMICAGLGSRFVGNSLMLSSYCKGLLESISCA